jgi:DNA-binding response OmpR family regulator
MMNGADRLANGATSDENNDLSGLSQARILVVDDDRDLTGLVRRELVGLGFTVDVVELAGDAMLAARNTAYALMIVDLGLPDRDGLELVRDLRSRLIETPILVLTARNRVEDRVSGLSRGADDYLVKPFAVPELRARVTALLRRPSRMKGNHLSVANIVVDRDSLEAVIDGDSLPLALKQFQLLELLVRRKNHVTPKRMIEETLYGFNDEVSTNTIEAQVYKLRQALRAAGAEATIETRRGIGYRLVDSKPDMA